MNILLIPNLGKKNAYECTCEVIKKADKLRLQLLDV